MSANISVEQLPPTFPLATPLPYAVRPEPSDLRLYAAGEYVNGIRDEPGDTARGPSALRPTRPWQIRDVRPPAIAEIEGLLGGTVRYGRVTHWGVHPPGFAAGDWLQREKFSFQDFCEALDRADFFDGDGEYREILRSGVGAYWERRDIGKVSEVQITSDAGAFDELYCYIVVHVLLGSDGGWGCLKFFVAVERELQPGNTSRRCAAIIPNHLLGHSAYPTYRVLDASRGRVWLCAGSCDRQDDLLFLLEVVPSAAEGEACGIEAAGAANVPVLLVCLPLGPTAPALALKFRQAGEPSRFPRGGFSSSLSDGVLIKIESHRPARIITVRKLADAFNSVTCSSGGLRTVALQGGKVPEVLHSRLLETDGANIPGRKYESAIADNFGFILLKHKKFKETPGFTILWPDLEPYGEILGFPGIEAGDKVEHWWASRSEPLGGPPNPFSFFFAISVRRAGHNPQGIEPIRALETLYYGVRVGCERACDQEDRSSCSADSNNEDAVKRSD